MNIHRQLCRVASAVTAVWLLAGCVDTESEWLEKAIKEDVSEIDAETVARKLQHLSFRKPARREDIFKELGIEKARSGGGIRGHLAFWRFKNGVSLTLTHSEPRLGVSIGVTDNRPPNLVIKVELYVGGVLKASWTADKK